MGLDDRGFAGAWTRFGLLAALYFSQGLPYGFFTQALPVMMRVQGFSLEEIGLSSLLVIPWALKFLWAPLVDRPTRSPLGRRRRWLIPLQISGVLVLSLMAVAGLASLPLVMTAVLLLNLIAATQDIATDGLAVDILHAEERGIGNGIQVGGYRIGMIVGGGALLLLFNELGATGAFLTMAGMMALATVPILLTAEPATMRDKTEVAPQHSLHFLRREGAFQVLALAALYKGGDAFSTAMIRPMLVDQGLGLTEIGLVLGTVGFAMGLLGALAGGFAINRFGRKRALWCFAWLQALAVLGYAYLSATTAPAIVVYVVVAFEHFAGGVATAAIFTCMMDWCSAETNATDYTVQASAVVIATGLASTLAGVSAQHLGYTNHFLLGGALTFLALPAVHFLYRAKPPSPL